MVAVVIVVVTAVYAAVLPGLQAVWVYPGSYPV